MHGYALNIVSVLIIRWHMLRMVVIPPFIALKLVRLVFQTHTRISASALFLCQLVFSGRIISYSFWRAK